VAAWYVQRRFEARGPTLVAGVGGFALAWGLGMAGVLVGINPAAMTALGVVGLLPFAVYVGCALYDRGRDATGVVFPFVVGGGVLATLAAERLIGLAGPNAWLTWDFLTSSLSAPATEAGIYPGVAGTILLMIVVILASFPVGVGAAVYLEEYATDTWFTRVIDVNISNLAGVPSVVYGLLGLGAFVRFGGLAPGTVLVGGMALSLLILPIVIINSREAIRAVPDSRRRAASGMGATRWQTVRTVVLPEAFPAILTGTILALGRAVGETAPLLIIGAPAIFGVPGQLGDRVGAIPLQIYTWASTFADEAFFTTVLAAGVVTILVVLLSMNAIAIVLRNKYQRDT
jgi:phosphate transport system permease protein